MSNECDCEGPKDSPQESCGGSSEFNCYPLNQTCEDVPNSDFITTGIYTSN